MKIKSFIIWPESLKTLEVICFLEEAGFKQNKDFEVIYSKILSRMVIKPLNQIILAEDALQLGLTTITI